MKEYLLELPITEWVCKLCGAEDMTKEANPHTRYHSCPRLGGLTAPMVDKKLNCKIEVNEREDFIANEIVQTDGDGRPVMNIKTTRDDGEDMIVFAPTSKMEV